MPQWGLGLGLGPTQGRIQPTWEGDVLRRCFYRLAAQSGFCTCFVLSGTLIGNVPYTQPEELNAPTPAGAEGSGAFVGPE